MISNGTADGSRRARALVMALAIAAAASAGLNAQLGTRPAEEWRKVLDAPERIAGLRVDEVIARLKLKPTDIVADLGAGTGPFVVPFARAVPSGTVYAVDVDAGFFPLIEEKIRSAGVTNVRTVLGAFADPKLPKPDVDLAFMHDVLHHIADRPAYVRTLTQYLKPAARVAIIDYIPTRSPHPDKAELQVPEEEARALMAGAGFKVVEKVALFDDKWFLVFSR